MTKKSKKLEMQEKSSLVKLTGKNKPSKDQKVVSYTFGDFISKFSFQYWREYYKQKVKKRSLFLIIMHLRNGKYDMFTVATDVQSFSYKGGDYLIDPDMIREDIHTGLNTLYYHQDCTAPFKITFNIDELRNMLDGTDSGVEKAINPFSLKSFIHSQVIEKVMKGQELSDDMRFIKMITVINLLVTAAVGVMFAKTMGWF